MGFNPNLAPRNQWNFAAAVNGEPQMNMIIADWPLRSIPARQSFCFNRSQQHTALSAKDF
jgi:hypothetical protein